MSTKEVLPIYQRFDSFGPMERVQHFAEALVSQHPALTSFLVLCHQILLSVFFFSQQFGACQ